MSDWLDELNPDERAHWDEWVSHVRRETLAQMDASAFVMQLYTDKEPDVKFAVEIGLGFLLDKPIFAIVMRGASVPKKLEMVADLIVEADLDTEEGREHLETQLQEFAKQFKE
jgi:nucleoside 2-deoxyribosyltransferase